MTEAQDKGRKPDGRKGSIPLDMLKAIVGGANPNEKKQVDGDLAVALTVGAPDHVADSKVAPQAKPAPAVVESKTSYGEDARFDMRLVFAAPESGKPDSRVTITATGQKGDANSVKVELSDPSSGVKEKLTQSEVSQRAADGNPLFKTVEARLKEMHGGDKKAPDFSKDIESGFRKSATGETAGPMGKVKGSDTHAKADVKTVQVKDPETGKTSTQWKSSVSTPAIDKAKAETAKAEKQQAQKELTDRWDADKAKKAEESKARQEQQAKPAENPLKDMRDARQASQTAQGDLTKATESQLKADLAKQLSAANVAKTDSAVKLAAQNQDRAAMDKAVKDHADALYHDALNAKALDKANKDQDSARKAVGDTGKSADEARAKFEQAKKELATGKPGAGEKDGEPGRGRANTVGAKPTTGEAGKDEPTRQRADTMPKQTSDKSVEPPKPGFVDKAAKLGEQHWGKVNQHASKMLEGMDKDAAKKAGTYHENKSETVLAGGIDKTTKVEGNVAKERITVAQVKTEGSTETYTSGLARGAAANWAVRAEAGIEDSKTVDHGNGVTTKVTDKAYASASFENKAKAVVTENSVSAEASTKVALHAEASHSTTTKIGGIETKDTVGVAAHAEANAKAGVRLGFDGLSASAKASVEASIKANLTKETKVGDHTFKQELEVYAKAKAEAKAEAEVTFNPFAKDGKIKAKLGVGAEASAGVGVEGTTGFHGKNGGADVGGGLYAGKIGAKADGDFEIKDGKVSASLSVGAALGIGITINIKIESNVKQAMADAARDIEKGNLAQKVLGHLTNNPVGGFFRGLFG
ncbi:hypothetical protein ABE438_19635 [Bosea sp. TWI1241]|uniref:hypothetical protein n=1 Tax=Bosea sp. TWI1241 TaxID=3148904 RepID=UPI00320AAB3E